MPELAEAEMPELAEGLAEGLAEAPELMELQLL
jgi:hypothetical protein